VRHRDSLRGHPRLTQAYRTWDRMDAGRKSATVADARRFLARLDRASGR
jgi:deoxyribodipyrimidine photolyase-related protein